jgi:aspartate racemase
MFSDPSGNQAEQPKRAVKGFLHIVDPTAREVQERGHMSVGLLGSGYTITGSYFVGPLREHYEMNVLAAEGEYRVN